MSEKNARHTALLVMDVQERIVANYASDESIGTELIRTIVNAIGGARAAGIPVIYVKVTFRPGYPEISERNASFSTVKRNNVPFTESDADAAIHAAVAPQPGDIVVTKRRVSAFTGSDLEVVLRGLDVRNLVLCGIATGGVVLSTVREAADRDFGLVVLRDACADMDAEVHSVLMTKIFPRQSTVMTVEEWNQRLSAPN